MTSHSYRSLRNSQHAVCNNVLRLAGELSIVRVLNDFQPLPILRVYY
ncbi:capsid protein [Escherichia coli]|nr:capsid protein [Escherichia coli]